MRQQTTQLKPNGFGPATWGPAFLEPKLRGLKLRGLKLRGLKLLEQLDFLTSQIRALA
jgi:hypothetical protein